MIHFSNWLHIGLKLTSTAHKSAHIFNSRRSVSVRCSWLQVSGRRCDINGGDVRFEFLFVFAVVGGECAVFACAWLHFSFDFKTCFACWLMHELVCCTLRFQRFFNININISVQCIVSVTTNDFSILFPIVFAVLLPIMLSVCLSIWCVCLSVCLSVCLP